MNDEASSVIGLLFGGYFLKLTVEKIKNAWHSDVIMRLSEVQGMPGEVAQSPALV